MICQTELTLDVMAAIAAHMQEIATRIIRKTKNLGFEAGRGGGCLREKFFNLDITLINVKQIRRIVEGYRALCAMLDTMKNSGCAANF